MYICVYIYSYRMLYRDLYYVGLSHSILWGQGCHFDIYGGTVSPLMFAALRHSPQKVAKDFLCAWVCITASLSHQHSDAQQRKWSARNQLRTLVHRPLAKIDGTWNHELHLQLLFWGVRRIIWQLRTVRTASLSTANHEERPQKRR